MKILPFLLGTGVGYVLGTRAGRERYEQLAQVYRRVADNPSVQAAAGVARAKAGEAVQAGVAVAKDRMGPTGPATPSGPSAPSGRPAAGEPAAPGRTVAGAPS